MPFQPGQSGNPKGSALYKPFKDALKRAIANADGDKDTLKQIAEALVAKALKGEPWAVCEVANRLDGKCTQPIGGDPESEPIRTITEIRTTIVDPRHSSSPSIPATPGPSEV